MYGKSETANLRALSLRVLGYSEEGLELLVSDKITQRDFDAVTLELASKMNLVSRLYADLADCLGTARFTERQEDSGELISRAAMDFIFR